MCRLFGIRITAIGKPVQDEGVLMVANHTSCLDIIVLLGVGARLLCRQERSRDLAVLLARWRGCSDTVFVERRAAAQAGEARDQIRDRLLAGDTLVLFPEGTSNDGNRVLPFKSALMGAAEARSWTDAQGERACMCRCSRSRSPMSGCMACRWAARTGRFSPGMATWNWCRIFGKR